MPDLLPGECEYCTNWNKPKPIYCDIEPGCCLNSIVKVMSQFHLGHGEYSRAYLDIELWQGGKYSGAKIQINYCPMCGRRIEV